MLAYVDYCNIKKKVQFTIIIELQITIVVIWFYLKKVFSKLMVLTCVSSDKALLKMGIRGVTVSDVRGFGSQGGMKERQAGKCIFLSAQII